MADWCAPGRSIGPVLFFRSHADGRIRLHALLVLYLELYSQPGPAWLMARLLEQLLAAHERERRRVTVPSGEIHLATRATMAAESGPIHQRVASGITHPPPSHAYARTLGALARLGESPVAGHPIRLHPLPGQQGIYTAQRNFLVLERRGGAWRAWWELEDDGATPPLDLEQQQ